MLEFMIDKNMDLLNFHVLKFHCHIYMNSTWTNNKCSLGVLFITLQPLFKHYTFSLLTPHASAFQIQFMLQPRSQAGATSLCLRCLLQRIHEFKLVVDRAALK